MGKSLKGKEFGKGISQRKDGLYQARFVNRFGKRQTIYDKTYNNIVQKLRAEQYEDEKQINTIITKEDKNERRVLTRSETEKFLLAAEIRFYYSLFVSALETGMRIGELCDLQWNDIDFKNKTISADYTLCYFSKEGKYVFERHDTKTNNGKRMILLTSNAIKALKRQKVQKQEIIYNGKEALEGYENLFFVTRNNQPTQQFLVQECIGLIIKNIQKEDTKFKYFTPHTFRHTFATRAIENGVVMV